MTLSATPPSRGDERKMKGWITVLLLTLLAGVVIAGLGSVLPALAADGAVVLYRVNSGGPEVPATDGGPDWEQDSSSALWGNPSPYFTGFSHYSYVQSYN